MRTTGRDLHIDIPLTRVALQFRPEGMIADKIFPIVPVGKQSDSYLIWSSADAFRTEDDRRSPNNEANVIERTVSSDTYFAKNYALKMPITLEDQKNMDAAYVDELRNGRVTYIKTKLMFNWEKRIANQVTSTSNVGSSSAVTSAWTDYTTGESDPMGDIWTALANVQDATGYAPNRIVFGDSAWRNFRRHADVVNIIHGNDGAGSGRSRLANMEQVKGIFQHLMNRKNQMAGLDKNQKKASEMKESKNMADMDTPAKKLIDATDADEYDHKTKERSGQANDGINHHRQLQ